MVEQTMSGTYANGGAAVATPSKSAASWPAIIAGAFVAIAVSLVLLALGSGLGFASISPWPGKGISGTTFAVTTAIWLIITQWVSAGIGGYIAGRLRTRWIGTHTHEVFFRDTAHGLITWAVASVVVAAVLGSSIGAAGHALGAAGAAAGHAAVEGASMVSQAGPSPGGREMAMNTSPGISYDIDRLLRPSGAGTTAQAASDPKPEVARIIANAATSGSVPDDDRTYLAQLVAARTGVTLQDAQKRVDVFISDVTDVQAKAKAAADAARKAAAQASIYLALSLLVGAFIASVSAALGGRLRDEHP
jgi:hypothetical protein